MCQISKEGKLLIQKILFFEPNADSFHLIYSASTHFCTTLCTDVTLLMSSELNMVMVQDTGPAQIISGAYLIFQLWHETGTMEN